LTTVARPSSAFDPYIFGGPTFVPGNNKQSGNKDDPHPLVLLGALARAEARTHWRKSQGG
jgi:hypothetical protein